MAVYPEKWLMLSSKTIPSKNFPPPSDIKKERIIKVYLKNINMLCLIKKEKK